MTTLPHMIANVGEILDIEDDVNDAKEGSGFVQKKSESEKKTSKALIIKTSGRHTMYLPSFGLVEPGELKPGDMIGVNKESFMVYDKLPAEYDSRVKAMEVDERPT